MKPRREAPLALAIIAVLAASVAWASVTRPLNDRVGGLIETAIEKTLSKGLGGLGLGFSYESASPRIAGSLRLKGLRASSGGRIIARAGSAELWYDAAALAGGSLVVTKLRLEDVAVDGRAEEDLATVKALVERFSSPEGGGEGLAPGTVLEIRRLSALVSTAEGAYASLSLRAADALVMEGGAVAASAVGQLSARDDSRAYGLSRLDAPFSVTARLGPDSSSVVARVSADTDAGRLSPLLARATVKGGLVSASVDPEGGLRRLELEWDPSSSLARLECVLDRWTPDSLFTPSGRLSAFAPWLSVPYTGHIAVSSDFSVAGTAGSVDISGVLPLSLPGGRPRFELAASGGPAALAVSRARIETGLLEASFAGDLSPLSLGVQGSLSAGFQLAEGVRAAAGFEVFGSDGSWFAYAPSIDAAGTIARDAALSVDYDGASVAFLFDAALPFDPEAVPAVPREGSWEPGAAGEPAATSAPRLTAEGRVVLDASPYLETSVRLDPVSLSAFRPSLGALLGQAASGALSGLSLGGDFSLFSDFENLSYGSSDLLFVYDGLLSAFGVIAFTGGLDSLEVRSIDATVAGYSLSGTASLDYGDEASLAFGADIEVEGVPYGLSGAMTDGSLVVSGDYGLSVALRSADGVQIGELSVVDMPVPILDSVSFVSASVRALYESADEWDLVVESASLSRPAGSASAVPEVSLSGAFDESGGRFGRIVFKDDISTLEGLLDVTWAFTGGLRVSADGTMAGKDGEFYALGGDFAVERGLAAIDGGMMDLRIGMRKAPLERLRLPGIRGLLDADAALSGTPADPRASFSFTLNGSQRSDSKLYLAGSGAYGGGLLSLAGARAAIAGQSVSNASLRYDFRDGSASLSASMSAALGNNVLTGAIAATGASGNPAAPFDDFRVQGAMSGLLWDGKALGAWPFSVAIARGSVAVSVGPESEATFRLAANGDLSASLARSLPLSAVATGKLVNGNLSADIVDVVADMPFLFSVIKLPLVAVDSGTGRGSLRVRGQLADPEIEGTVDFENFYISVPDFVSVPIGPLDEPLYFTGRGMESFQSNMTAGDALVTVSLESTLHSFIPDELRLVLKTEGDGLVPVDTSLLGLEMEGFAAPDLVIDINRDGLKIGGTINVPKADVVLTTGVIKRKGAAASSGDMSVDLDLAFGKAVRVYFPDKRLPIVYGQADPSSRLSVLYDSGQGHFAMKGTTTLRGGTVFYIQRNFYLRSATIEFDEDEDQFNPLVNIEAETRSDTASGTALITLRAVDRRLSDLSFTLESVPSMTEADIAQLLGQNLLEGSGEGDFDIGKAIVENVDVIPQLNVASILERNLQALLGFDLFVVRTQVVQRWLYDIALTGLSTEAEPATLADYLDDTAVIAGKYIGDRLFFQVMLSLAEDTLATGTSLSLDSDISLEWRAPHFTVTWSMKPENPDTLFVTDQSFSFVWRIPLQ